MRPTAALTVASSTRTPVSLAICNCARSMIIRSRTCLSSTSRGGIAICCRCNCCSATRARKFNSFCVITSSLTTATTRSSRRDAAPGAAAAAGAAAAVVTSGMAARGDCANAAVTMLANTAAIRRASTDCISTIRYLIMDSLAQHLWAAAASVATGLTAGSSPAVAPPRVACRRLNAAHPLATRDASLVVLKASRLARRRIDQLVAGNITLQSFQRTGADTAQAVQFDREKDRGRGLFGEGCKALRGEACHPATALVFEPRQRFHRATVADRVVDARQRVPARRQRPLRRQVDLFQFADLVTISKIDH